MPVSFIMSFFPTLVGFASMPQCLTIKPMSMLDGTPKTHFSGLSFQR
jgi:hypothetical protein